MEFMKNKKRNIDDAFSPQRAVNPTNITDERTQEHLEEKTSVEDIYGENDTIKKEKQSPRDIANKRERNHGLDINQEG
jgi:hypothetical protein